MIAGLPKAMLEQDGAGFCVNPAEAGSSGMIAALSLQQCGNLPCNPLIDANSLLELPDADTLRGLVSHVDTAGTQDQRRRQTAVLGGFGPYPREAP